MTELLPCPFCGGKADSDRTMERFEYCTGGPNSVMDYGYYVYCTQCGAGTGVVDVPPPSEEEAAKEWNRRAQPEVTDAAPLDMPDDVREVLREALHTLDTDIDTKGRYDANYSVETAKVRLALAWLDSVSTQPAQPLDAPDSPGFWAWEEGTQRGVSEVYEGFGNELIVSDEPGGLGAWYFPGRKWYKLQMPWSAQPDASE
jgi:Lar family restriction alleviation protein